VATGDSAACVYTAKAYPNSRALFGRLSCR
jgi:hypothetical protein